MGSRSTQETTMPFTVKKGPGPGGIPGQLRRVARVLGVTALVLLPTPSAGAQSTRYDFINIRVYRFFWTAGRPRDQTLRPIEALDLPGEHPGALPRRFENLDSQERNQILDSGQSH